MGAVESWTDRRVHYQKKFRSPANVYLGQKNYELTWRLNELLNDILSGRNQNFNLLISRLLNIVEKSFCTPDEAMDPTFRSGGCLAGFGKWSRRCPEGVWDVSNILDYLRQFSYTALSKLGLQLVLDASQAAINKRPSLFSVAGTTKCRGRFENSGFWLVRTLVMLHVPDLDRPIRGRAY